MMRRALWGSVFLVLSLEAAAACRRAPPGDSGGAATGDQVGKGRIGSARSHDSLERERPVDTGPAPGIHDELGADTSGR